MFDDSAVLSVPWAAVAADFSEVFKTNETGPEDVAVPVVAVDEGPSVGCFALKELVADLRPPASTVPKAGAAVWADLEKEEEEGEENGDTKAADEGNSAKNKTK